MNSEIKNKKWLWGGICLQLSVGYTIGCLVYTIGTLITAPAMLNIGAATGGLIAAAVMAAIVISLCIHSNRKVKSEYALNGK